MKPVNTPEKIDSMNRLPPELVVRIFGFLTPVELWQVSQVCRSWHKAASDNSIWKAFIDFTKESAHEKAMKFGSLKLFFIVRLEYRKLDYFISDKRGFHTAHAYEYFEAIRSREWSKWEQEKYLSNLNKLRKDHEWITEVLDTVCRVSYFKPNGINIAINNPDYYVEAFNYLYEQNALNEATIACINACVDDENLSEQFHIQHYAHFVLLFYRADLLNDENLIAIRTSADPDLLCVRALRILLDALKSEADAQKKQIMFAQYRDRLLALSQTCNTSVLEAYAECMVNLYTHGILLSNPDHVVIYDELLTFRAVTALSYSNDFIKLHNANLLLGLYSKPLRDLILKNPRREGGWRAEEIVDKYKRGTLKSYVVEQLEKLNIKPETVSDELEKLEELVSNTEIINETLEALPNSCYEEESNNNDGRGSDDTGNQQLLEHETGTLIQHLFEEYQKPTESDRFSEQSKALAVIHDDSSHHDSVICTKIIRWSPFNMFANPPGFDESTSSTQMSVKNTDDRPITKNEKEFKKELLRVLRVQEDVEMFFNALREDYTNENFEIISKFLLNQDNPREIFLNRDYGAAAIAELHGNAQLALFIRMAAKLDCMLYEDKHSLLKRLPTNDYRTKAAEAYLHQNYRKWAYNILGGYIINEKSPTEDDTETFRRHWNDLNSAFILKKHAPTEYSSAKSIAKDRTSWSQVRREFMMVTVNFLLHVTIVGIVLNVINKVQTGNWFFFTETKSKEKLNKIKKTILHGVISCRVLQH